MDIDEASGTDQNEIARGQMHDPEKCCARHVTRQTADNARLQINYERVTEALVHERNTLIIGGEISTLAKVCEHLDIAWKMIEWITGFPLAESRV